jgi:hypothetical protein
MTRIANYILPIYFKISRYDILKHHNKNLPTEELFIVSLTTFPTRINKVWLTIETILRQKEKPDKILLWLYKGEFNGKDTLPKNLLRLEKRGLEIRFCDENLMPHLKYYYTMLENPNASVVTIDDDMFYPPDFLSKLKSVHAQVPNTIICSITRKIKIVGDEVRPYTEWKYNTINTKPSFSNLSLGVGGVLFPPNSLHNETFNKNYILKLSLRADDLWLKIMSIKNETKVASMASEYRRFFIPIIYKDNISLMDSNIGEGKNDQIFKSLLQHYQIPVSIFKIE